MSMSPGAALVFTAGDWAEPLAHAAEDRLGPEAVGALEVAEHHQLQRRPALAADVIDVFQRG